MTISSLPFSNEEYGLRQDNLRALLDREGLPAFLITSPENMFYFCGYDTTGFHSFPQMVVFPRSGKPVIVTRHYELDAARRAFNLDSIGYDDSKGPAPDVLAVLRSMSLENGTLGIEKNVPWLRVKVFEELSALAPKATFVDKSGLLESLRSIKSDAEITMMRAAGSSSLAGMKAAVAAIAPGVPDYAIASASFEARLAAGSNHIRSPTYVVTGPRSGIAHQTWDGSVVKDDDIVFMEFGGNVNHYGAGCMHTVLVGKVDDTIRKASEATLEALEAGCAAIRPGTAAQDVHGAVRRVLSKYGFAENQHSRTGYAIGIEFITWIESGGISLFDGDTRLLTPRMTFHVLPHIRFPGVGTVGYSRTVLCTENDPEFLTPGPSADMLAI